MQPLTPFEGGANGVRNPPFWCSLAPPPTLASKELAIRVHFRTCVPDQDGVFGDRAPHSGDQDEGRGATANWRPP